MKRLMTPFINYLILRKKLVHTHSIILLLKCFLPTILINTLTLQEAKDSSAIENIITTHDELYKSDVSAKQFSSYAAKEVYSYATALQNGYEEVKKNGLLTNSSILEIQQTSEENSAGFRKLPGTLLKNDRTGEVVHS
jgi:hypothetical protein